MQWCVETEQPREARGGARAFQCGETRAEGRSSPCFLRGDLPLGDDGANSYDRRGMSTVPKQYQDLVAKKLAEDGFESEEDVLCAALELLAEQDRKKNEQFEHLREWAAVGFADLEAGRFSTVTVDDMKRRARERFLS